MSTRLICVGLVCLMVPAPSVKINSQAMAVGARSIALSGVSAGLEDTWAVVNNPAGLAGLDHVSVATSFEQRFLMKETGFYAVAASIPANKGCFGISGMFSGYSSFIDQKTFLGYGMPFGKYVHTGISLVYVFQKAGTEGSPVHMVSYELGTIVNLSKRMNLAFAAFNPFQLSYKSKDYGDLPAVFKLGLSFQYSQAFIIYSEIEKNIALSPCLKIGMEYTREIFYIRGGIRIFPFSCSFGAAVRQQRFLLEFSSSWHQYLGFTPQVSLQYDFK